MDAITRSAMTPARGLPLGPRAFAVVAIVGWFVLVALGAGMTFFSDEWAYIASRSLADPVDWLRPHNEHWSTLPIILYRLMVETIGIGSYLPYLAVIVALHAGVSCLAYRLIEHRSGRGPAFLGGLLVLFFGSGFENIFWGFQTGFTASMLTGLAAMDLTDRGPSRGRAMGVAALLLVSLASSGTGLIVSVAVGLEWLADRRWRQRVPWLVIPAVSYVAWYVLFGRSGVTTMRNPFSLDAVADVPSFVIRGLGNAGGAITGVGASAGVIVAALVITWAIRRGIGGSLPPRTLGVLVAIVAQYALIGLVRGGLFDGQVVYTRYAYISGILLLLGVAALAGRPTLPASRRLRPFAIAGAMSVVGLAFIYNGALLAGGRELFLGRGDMTRALVTAGLHRPLPGTTDPARTLVLVPSPLELERISSSYGDPRTDALVPFAVRPVPHDLQAEAERRLREGADVPQHGG